MKTHTLARQLTALARALRALPDMEIDNLKNLQLSTDKNIALGLSTLTSLSTIDKSEWVEFINHNNIPVDIRPRDAARDIIGKIMTYLQENDEARRRIAKAATEQKSSVSPELQRAFNILLQP